MYRSELLNYFLDESLGIWTRLPDINPTRSFWLNIMNTYLAKSVSYFRYNIKIGSFQPTPINYYSLSLLPSGAFKDATVKFIQHRLFGAIDMYASTMNDKMAQKYNSELEAKLVSYYGKKTREYMVEYKMAHIPSKLDTTINTATSEGFCQRIMDVNKMRFGSTMHSHSEFLDYFFNKTKDAPPILSMTKDLFYGQLNVTALKSDKGLHSINDVSHNVLYYSSSSRLEDNDNMIRFKNELNTGLLRRCHFCMPMEHDEKSLQSLSLQERKVKEDEIEMICQMISKQITNGFITGHKYCSENADYKKTVVLSDAAEELFNEYQNKINEEIQLNPDLAGVINTKKEKVAKLSAIYYLAENKFINADPVPEKYVSQAIHFVDESHRYTEQFLEMKLNNRVSDKLYEFLQNKGVINEGEVSRYEWGKNYLQIKNIAKAEMRSLKLKGEGIFYENDNIYFYPAQTATACMPYVMIYPDKRSEGECDVLSPERKEGFISPYCPEDNMPSSVPVTALNTLIFYCEKKLPVENITDAFIDVNHFILVDESYYLVGLVLDPKVRMTIEHYERVHEDLVKFFPLFTPQYKGELIDLSTKEMIFNHANKSFSIGYLENNNRNTFIQQLKKSKTAIETIDEIVQIHTSKTIDTSNYKMIDAQYYKERS